MISTDRLGTFSAAVGDLGDDAPEIDVVVAHSERATLRVGDVFMKIDTDQARIDRKVEVMARAPIPTPEVLSRKPVLALAAVPGMALGVLNEPSRASSAAWVAAGTAVRTLHDAPLPPWPGSQCQQQPVLSSGGTVEFPPLFDSECEWLVAIDVVSADVVRRNHRGRRRGFGLLRDAVARPPPGDGKRARPQPRRLHRCSRLGRLDAWVVACRARGS